MPSTDFDLLLLGGSHMRRIVLACYERGVEFRGGALGGARLIAPGFFSMETGSFELKSNFRNPIRKELAGLDTHTGLILTDFGLAMHGFSRHYAEWATQRPGAYEAISDAAFKAIVLGSRQGALDFYAFALEKGLKLHAFVPPVRGDNGMPEVALRAQRLMLARMREMGVPLIDIGDQVSDENGYLQVEYNSSREDDLVHGNRAWGRLVLDCYMTETGLEARAEPSAAMRKGAAEQFDFLTSDANSRMRSWQNED